MTEIDESKIFLIMLQLSDSAFPTGGFSYSMGCEALIQRSFISTADDIKNIIISNLENSGSFNIPFIQNSYENYEDLEIICQLDHFNHVCLNNQIANRVSLQQGKSMLFTSYETFKYPCLLKLHTLIENGKMNGHHAIVFGFICAVLQISRNHTLEMYLFMILRTIMTSLVRLGKAGAIEAQSLQFEIEKIIPNIIERNIERSVEDSTVLFPLIDIFQNSHETLFRKMFYS